MSTTSISSPSSLTNTLPLIESSTRPATPIDPMSPFTKQEYLPPTSVSTTQSEEFPATGILSVDIPIYARCLVNNFPDKQTNAYLSSQLLDFCLASTLDGHMNMGSPLYALYKAFLQCHRLATLISTTTVDAHHVLCRQILRSIHEELEGDLFLVMYQLGMPVFADDVERYCRELSDTSPTFAPNTPTASSSLLLQTKNSMPSNAVKLIGQAILDEPLYPQIILALTKPASIVTVWDISASIASSTPV